MGASGGRQGADEVPRGGGARWGPSGGGGGPAVEVLDVEEEVPIYRATLTVLADRLAEAQRSAECAPKVRALRGAHRGATGPGNVVKKCAYHPALLDAVEGILGPNIALVGAFFAPDARAAAAEARGDAESWGAAGWIDADGRFACGALGGAGTLEAAFEGADTDGPGVCFGFVDAAATASDDKDARVVRGVTGREDEADERVRKRLTIAQYSRMEEGTVDDLSVQCAIFNMDKRRNQADRVLGLLRQLRGIDVGTRCDLYQHSLQSAALALADGRDEEYVVCALLHDIGELLCPNAHGELPASLLRPYVSPKSWWVLAHHEIFQGYYYLDKCGGDKHARERFRYHKYFGACEEFCYKYDQAAFDPEYELPDLDVVFAPMVRRVLAREPYWHLGHLDTPTCEAKDAIAQGYE